MNTPVDTEPLIDFQDIRTADDDSCGVTVYLDPRDQTLVAVSIETGYLVARSASPAAIAAHIGAELISYGTDGVTGFGGWDATVQQGRDLLADLDDYAHDIETLAANAGKDRA